MPLQVSVNDKLIAASSKRDTQAILEEELYDVPKLAIEKMCIISFSAFNSSLVKYLLLPNLNKAYIITKPTANRSNTSDTPKNSDRII